MEQTTNSSSRRMGLPGAIVAAAAIIGCALIWSAHLAAAASESGRFYFSSDGETVGDRKTGELWLVFNQGGSWRWDQMGRPPSDR